MAMTGVRKETLGFWISVVSEATPVSLREGTRQVPVVLVLPLIPKVRPYAC